MSATVSRTLLLPRAPAQSGRHLPLPGVEARGTRASARAAGFAPATRAHARCWLPATARGLVAGRCCAAPARASESDVEDWNDVFEEAEAEAEAEKESGVALRACPCWWMSQPACALTHALHS